MAKEGTCGNFGCFFFMDGVGNQNNASAAISALLHQLYQSQHGLIAHAMKKFEGTPGHIFTRFSTLWPILVNSIDDAKTRDIVWVLDGLDECESKSLRQFITSFKIFFDSHCSAENRLSKCSFKVILLSRPHSLIQQTLGLFTDRDLIHPNNNKFRLSGEDESQAITTDIIRFAQWKINDLASASALPTEVLERLQGKLVVGADFTFLWISLIIKMVDDSTVNGISVAGVEAILNTTSLNDVYQHLLRGTSREFPGKTRKLLSIILASARPLTVDEMCVAVEVEEEGQGSSTQSLAMLGQLLHRPFDNHIRQLCGHFVRIRRRKLYFVHQTAREFLMNESFQLEATPLTETLASCVLPNMADAIWQPIKLEQANKTLLRICVSYIKMFNTREKGRTDSLWDHGQIAQYLDMCRGDPLRAFFPYAAIHWIQHYRPLRKDLFNEFDYLLQPGTGIFDVWIRVHSTWSYETGVSNEGKGAILTNSEVDVPEEPSAILILLEDQHLPYVGNGELQDLRWRFDRLQDWLRYAWYFRRPASTMIMQKFSKLKQGLEDQISQTAGGQSGGSEANWPWNDLTSLRHLTGELEEERRKDFRANSDFVLEKSMALRQDLRHQISRSTKRVLGMSGEGGLKAEWMGNIDRQNRHLLLLDTLTGQLEEEQDRRIGMVSQEDKAKSLERQKHIIARLHSQTEELEQKRLKAFAANPDLKRVRTENRVENLLNWEILAERQRQDILKQPKKEEDLHEVLVHFGLFDLDEEGLEDDEFLSEYWQPRIDALNEHRDVDEEEEDDFGDEKVEANIPDRVKHYIREKRRMRIRGSLGAGTPGAELPGLSNPEAWTFKDLRVSHHRASSE
ncbi:hypothetical protein QQX98_004582 [Neonectria punicea]|uniref:NACHT domain-containing protein n=1 Tax=Neonectria punicea TaxID=979145 RepID=A0ABR1H8P1_9HYPO